MNCREAQSHLFAADAGALDNTRRAALDQHVAACAQCDRVRSNLQSAVAAWRMETSRATLPDAEKEWHIVRRRVRGGVNVGDAQPVARSRHSWMGWVTVPLGAAAALALTLSATHTAAPQRSPHAHPQTARADYVEAPGAKASTQIYMDEKSGWLFVVASDEPRRG